MARNTVQYLYFRILKISHWWFFLIYRNRITDWMSGNPPGLVCCRYGKYQKINSKIVVLIYVDYRRLTFIVGYNVGSQCYSHNPHHPHHPHHPRHPHFPTSPPSPPSYPLTKTVGHDRLPFLGPQLLGFFVESWDCHPLCPKPTS